MKSIPRSILYNRNIMQQFALFSEPIIRVVDKLVGATNAMRVDVSTKGGDDDDDENKKLTVTSLIVHADLEMAVGLATAAFALEVLKGKTKSRNNHHDDGDTDTDTDTDKTTTTTSSSTIPSGVWYPAELPKQARLNILEIVKEGTSTYIV
mmetsp:Transcript_31503/g.35727  ORF Transcript_31503/g.35727 Transcript_31503/m.35727 type:complete len:151 (-) Transcript_31503:102-554(-)